MIGWRIRLRGKTAKVVKTPEMRHNYNGFCRPDEQIAANLNGR